MAKEEAKTIDEYKYDDPAIINVEDIGTALCMFDKLTRIAEGRRVTPFDQSDNVVYLHRIMIFSQVPSQSLPLVYCCICSFPSRFLLPFPS